MSVQDQQKSPALVGKALLASKSPWGTILVTLLAYAGAKWGLQLDEGSTDLIAGLGVIVGSYAVRYFAKHPIHSILPKGASATTPLVAFLAAAGLLGLLSACTWTTDGSGNATLTPDAKAQAIDAKAKAVLPVAYKFACAAIANADGTFKALAPALEAQGKLTSDQVSKEATIKALWDGRCANPAGDLTQLAADGMTDAATIYAFIALPVTPPAK